MKLVKNDPIPTLVLLTLYQTLFYLTVGTPSFGEVPASIIM
jgi:hypothetical protein